MNKPKSRHREYVNAIKHTKERLEVGMDYQPFLINRAFWSDETLILHLNYINRKPLKVYTPDTREQRLFEKQIHFDYLLSVVKKTPLETDNKLVP